MLPSNEERAEFRVHRYKLALIASVCNKAATGVLQLVMIPVVVHMFKGPEVGFFVALIAALNWLWTSGVGIGPGLTVEVAKASGDRSLESRIFGTGFYVIGALICSIIGIWAFGGDIIHAQHINLFMTFLILMLLVGLCEGAQSGYQEQYLINWATTISSAVACVALGVVAKFYPTLGYVYVAGILYAGLAMPRCVNAIVMLWRHRHLVKCPVFDYDAFGRIFGIAVAFTIVQAASLARGEGGIWIINNWMGSAHIGSYALLVHIGFLGFGLAAMQINPLLPAITDARAMGHLEWIDSMGRKVVRNVLIFALLFMVSFSTVGAFAIKMTYGPQMVPSTLMAVCFGLLFIAQCWEAFHIILLFGLGSFALPMALCVVQNGVALAVSVPLVHHYGAIGCLIANLAATCLFNGWMLPVAARRRVDILTGDHVVPVVLAEALS